MLDLPERLGLEFKTIEAMVNIYCKPFHKTHNECTECRDFLIYVNEKLDRCPYGQHKPTCNKYPIHCYKPRQREQAIKMMRYAGPWMLIYHPVLAIKHLRAAQKAVPNNIPKWQSHRHIRKRRLDPLKLQCKE